MAASTFDTAWAAADGPLAALFDEFAETVTWAADGVAPVEVQGVVELGAVRVQSDGLGRARESVGTLEVLESVVGAGVVPEKVQATVRGVAYLVGDVVARSGGTVLVELVRLQRHEVSRPGYRQH